VNLFSSAQIIIYCVAKAKTTGNIFLAGIISVPSFLVGFLLLLVLEPGGHQQEPVEPSRRQHEDTKPPVGLRASN